MRIKSTVTGCYKFFFNGKKEGFAETQGNIQKFPIKKYLSEKS